MGKFGFGMKKASFAIGASLILAFSMVQTGHAANTDKMNAQQIEALLEDAGFAPEVVMDEANGAPVAVAKVGDIEFIVRALACEEGACERLLLFANFRLGRPISQQDYKIINSFNESKADGRAYVLEKSGEIGVDYMIDLTGGVSAGHISSRLNRWQGVVDSFLEAVRAGNTGS